MPSAEFAAVLRAARAAIVDAAEEDGSRRLVAPAVADLDRALARLDPGWADRVGLTPLELTEPDAESVEAMRRELERLRFGASASQTLVDALLDQSPHGIIVADADGRLTLQNPAAERIWAGSATAGSVGEWGRFRAFHADGTPFAPEDWALATCLRTREPVAAREVHIQRFDGTHGWLVASSAPLVSPQGELLGAVTVFADVTALRQALRDRQRRALEINDEIVQALTVAAMAERLGREEEWQAARDAALAAARRIATDLLRGAAEGGEIVPGALRLSP